LNSKEKEKKMEIETAIVDRRAVKKFDPQHTMNGEEIERILSLAVLAPSAFNIQHWRFVVVRDEALRKAMREISYRQEQLTDASMLVILCGDTRAWEKEPVRYWRKAPEGERDGIAQTLTEYYAGNEQVQRNEAIRSCSLAAATMMLAAKGMGYDSCPIGLTDFAEIGKLINLPSDHVIAMVVAIGKGLAEPWGRKGQLTLDEVVIRDRF